MKKYFLLIMLIASVLTFGQNKKNDKKGETTKPTTQSTTTTTTQSTQQAPPQTEQQQPQVNPLLQHFYVKFNVAMRFNDPDVAKDALYDLLVENATDSLILQLASMYYENQKYPSTIMVCQEILARNPKNPAALEMTATAYEGLNINDKALQNYESLYLQTNNYGALYKMAFLQFDLKRFKECSATSDILLSKKEADELKVSYQTADNKTKEFPIKVAILNLKGMIAKESGDNAGAKKLFEQALAIAPDFVQAKENLNKIK